MINAWLGKSVQFPQQTSVGEVPSENGDANYIHRDERAVKPDVKTQNPTKTKHVKIKRTTSVIKSASLIQPQLQLPIPHSTRSLHSPQATGYLPAPGRV